MNPPSILRTIRWTAIGCMFVGTYALAEQSGDTDVKVVSVNDCIVQFARQVEVPALATGAIREVLVRPNQSIQKSSVLARLDDEALRIQREAAQLRITVAERDAQDEIELDYASAVLEEAQSDLDSHRSLHRDRSGAVSRSQLRRLELAVERAKLEVARADKDRYDASVQLQMRNADLKSIDQRLTQLVSVAPFDGVVLAVHKQPGEWIEAGQPIARVASIDRLHVHALVSLDELSPQRCRRGIVEVYWRDASSGQTKSLSGFVQSVDSDILQGGRFRFHAEIKNYLETNADGGDGDWMLKPGMAVQLKIRIPNGARAAGTRTGTTQSSDRQARIFQANRSEVKKR